MEYHLIVFGISFKVIFILIKVILHVYLRVLNLLGMSEIVLQLYDQSFLIGYLCKTANVATKVVNTPSYFGGPQFKSWPLDGPT
jgi:hypothetical protein